MTANDIATRNHRGALVTGIVVLGLIAAGVAGWALHAVLATPDVGLEDAGYTTVAVREGSIGQSLTLNTAARWNAAPIARNRALGTVTSVWLHPGSMVASGTRLYSVDLRPVVAIAGKTPMFRDLTAGVAGPDVLQLERLLVKKGYLSSADTHFTATTATGVKRWQRSLGMEADGVVRLGDVVFVRSMPARLGLDKVVSTGAQLVGGEEIRSFGEPTFVIRATREQAGKMTAGSPVTMTGPDGQRWSAEVSGQRTGDDDTSLVDLAAAGEARSICGRDCGAIPTNGETLLVSKIEVVRPMRGLIVPASAVVTDASGRSMVVYPDGTRISVTVAATAAGQAVITGVNAGQFVRAPAQ